MANRAALPKGSAKEDLALLKYKQGLSATQVASLLGCSFSAVRTCLKRNNVLMRPLKSYNKKKYSDGLTSTQRYRQKVKNDPVLLQADRDYMYDRALRQKYGLSREEYNELLESQDRRCLICGRDETEVRLVVDHCHKTGNIRGLLCGSHNSLIGYAEDNPEYLNNAIEYLRMPPYKSASAPIKKS